MNQREITAPAAVGPERSDAIRRDAVARGEPAWLVDQRLTAWERACAIPVPTTTTEGWRRTDLTGLDLEGLMGRAGDQPRSPEPSSDEIAFGELAGALRLVDGVVVERRLDPSLEQRGVLLMTLDEAVRQRPDLVERYLGRGIRGDEGKFVALAAALWQGGVFLYVPRGIGIDRPVVGQSRMASGAACFFRTLVVVEEGADVTYVDDHTSDAGVGDALASGAVEVFAGQAARVRYSSLQHWDPRTWHFNRLRAEAERDARVDWLVVAVGGRLHRAEIDGVLVGQGSEMEMTGLIFGSQSQHFDHQTVQDHLGNDTRSDLNFKAALADESSSNYTGLIRVNKTSLRTNSNLENRNLLLSDHSRAESDPRLEILNSDVVRCAHGATVGPLDPEILYYIESRGIPREAARRLVVEAFFEPVLKKIPVEAIRTSVWRRIQRRLGQTIEAGDGQLESNEWQLG